MPPMPGIMPMILLIGPSFFVCPSSFLKSSRVNSPLRSRASCLAISSWSNFCWACSTSVSTSPMPRMRPAMRSGWNSSKASRCSPVPTNLIGTPVTALTDSAAPPRASPSSLVMITPSSSSASLNALALRTASWPGHRVHHQVDLLGLDAAVDLRQLGHQLLVDVQPAGRVEDEHVAPGGLGLLHRRLAQGHRVLGRQVGVDGQAELLAEDLQLLDGGGALQVGRHQHRLSPPLLDAAAPACRRWSSCRTLAGRRASARSARREVQRVVDRAHQLDQLLVDDADELLGGIERL